MKLQPLRGKVKVGRDDTGLNCLYLEDVKSAVEFYKKYRDNYILFSRDFSPSKYTGAFRVKIVTESDEEYNKKWNDWLFDYCFGDVLE